MSPRDRNRPLHVTDVAGVGVRYWYPSKPVLPGRIGREVPLRRPLYNFGDQLSPIIVERVVRARGLSRGAGNLIAIGSVLHLLEHGDTVWGSGVNGKQVPLTRRAPLATATFAGVRGPLTASVVEEATGRRPAIIGDPGLAVPDLFPEVVSAAQAKRRRVCLVPNVNDLPRFRKHPDLLDPRLPVETCLRTIAESEVVVASSLHGLVVADALGIPTILVQPGHEDGFKYRDYYGGLGVDDFPVAVDIDDAMARAMRGSAFTAPTLDASTLLSAFPAHLWAAS